MQDDISDRINKVRNEIERLKDEARKQKEGMGDTTRKFFPANLFTACAAIFVLMKGLLRTLINLCNNSKRIRKRCGRGCKMHN